MKVNTLSNCKELFTVAVIKEYPCGNKMPILVTLMITHHKGHMNEAQWPHDVLYGKYVNIIKNSLLIILYTNKFHGM